MIALGWTSDVSTLPPGFVTRRMRRLHVLALPKEQAATPRARLAMQIALFEHDVPFLPVPPGRQCTLAEAMDIAARDEDRIRHAIRHLAGLGQLSLSVTWDGVEAPLPPAGSGREWLRARHAHLRQEQRCRENAREILADLGQRLNWPTSGIVIGEEAANLHVRLAKSDEAAAVSAIRARTGQRTASALSLTISGLWPPFAFMPDVFGPERIAA